MSQRGQLLWRGQMEILPFSLADSGALEPKWWQGWWPEVRSWRWRYSLATVRSKAGRDRSGTSHLAHPKAPERYGDRGSGVMEVAVQGGRKLRELKRLFARTETLAATL